MLSRVRWARLLCALLAVLLAALATLAVLHGRLREVGRQLNGLAGGAHPLLSSLVADDDLVVIYNRIPKTGSTTLMDGIAYQLCKTNRFSVIHLNVSRNKHTLNLLDQLWFVKNVTNWHERKPALYHGHLAYIDFTAFGARPPIWLQVVREPLDRLVSYYYFLRCGDDHRPWLRRSKHNDANTTLDQCVARGGRDCDPAKMWLQIPFFCGTAPECWRPGSQWALDQAKRNLVDKYLLVGTTDRLADFVSVLESVLPRMFRGAVDQLAALAKRDGAADGRIRRTKCKRTPQPETVASLKATLVWRMEHELYDFAAANFAAVFDRMVLPDGQGMRVANQLKYEKIKPALSPS